MKAGWKHVPLGELLKVQNGYAFSSTKFSFTSGMPLIRIRDLKSGIGTEIKFDGAFDPAYLAQRGDFLIGMDGEFRCYEWQGKDALLNQRVCRLIDFSGDLLPRFLFYGINKYLKDIEDVTSFTTVKHLSAKTIKSIAIPLPPLEEQQQIVAMLDEAFEGLARARANAEANLQNARELLDTVREITLDPTQAARLSAVRLQSLIDIKHGFAFKSEFFADHGSHVVLTPGNYFETGGYKDRGAKQKYYSGEVPRDYVLSKGDLLMAMTEQAPGLLGSSIIVPDDDRFLHNQRLGLIVPREGVAWSADFFFHVFNLTKFRQALSDTCTGATVRHTSPSRIQDVVVPYVDDEAEQCRLADYLYEREDEYHRVERSYRLDIQDLDALRQSLLQKAFAGELT